MERLISLSDFDIDYSNHQDSFKDLAKLAAKVAGTDISLVNLIDTFTQWTISNHGLDIDQMPREDSVCQYTIAGGEYFEVADLKDDARFKDKFYVVDDPNLRYYFGVPLKTKEGSNLGALCVLDKRLHTVSPEKIELLKIIADEIVNRLKAFKVIDNLKHRLSEAKETQRKVAHDIRGPLGGIIGLAQIISEQGHDNQIDEVLEFINLIHKSGKSILELADEILSADQPKALKSDEFNLLLFKDKLEKLYQPQAKSKDISFTININHKTASTPFSKNKLLQITGNLISNAMKFTPRDGKITVDLNLVIEDTQNQLQIKVSDSGVGMNEAAINAILKGSATSTDGTGGEQGYGFGLALVKHLIEGLKGTLNIYSNPGNGAIFEVILPQAQ
ncbi:MAG: GAF domain-containing sensor histidine kinase [Mucilaginibacter sp.]